MSTTTDLTTLKINYLTQAQYDAAITGGTINDDEIYMTPSATADYIVDEGSVTASPTGAFNYYRKWSNGKAEFWYSYYSSSGLTTATWSSPLAYKDVTTFSNIWDGVFTTINIVNVLTRDSQAISIYPLSWTTSGVSTMRFVTVGTKSNNAYGISLYAFGTWE